MVDGMGTGLYQLPNAEHTAFCQVSHTLTFFVRIIHEIITLMIVTEVCNQYTHV